MATSPCTDYGSASLWGLTVPKASDHRSCNSDMSSVRDPLTSESESVGSDAEYAAFLREVTAKAALADTRPALSSGEAAERMALVRAQLQARLDKALAKKKRS